MFHVNATAWSDLSRKISPQSWNILYYGNKVARPDRRVEKTYAVI